MTPLSRVYIHRYGEAAKVHGSSINGPCPFCDGGTDRFIVWLDRSENLGKTCTEHGIRGVFYCRQCEASGDTLEYLMKAEGMKFKEACAELGITPRSEKDVRPAPVEKPRKAEFEGRKAETPKELWRAHAARMDEAAVKALPECSAALRWLRERGITLHLAQRYGLGFLPGENGRNCRFRPFASFGLPNETKKDGSPKTRMWIPRGISIPSREDGDIVMWRIRRPNGDVPERDGRKMDKYWELKGGARVSYHLPPDEARHVTVYLIVEGEMDAILLHAVAGGALGVAAMRSATNKPDSRTHEALARADLILVSLDSDKAGATGMEWWLKTYAKARPFPIPGFKDPGDAFKAGFDLRLWLEAGMPRSIALPPSLPLSDSLAERGSEEASLGRHDSGGKGGEEYLQTAAPVSEVELRNEFSDLLSAEKMKGLRAALPSYFAMEAMPREVLALAALWSGTPIKYMKYPAGGFEWVVSSSFQRRCPEFYARFMRMATVSRDVTEWLAMHMADVVDGRNFLDPFGEKR